MTASPSPQRCFAPSEASFPALPSSSLPAPLFPRRPPTAWLELSGLFPPKRRPGALSGQRRGARISAGELGAAAAWGESSSPRAGSDCGGAPQPGVPSGEGGKHCLCARACVRVYKRVLASPLPPGGRLGGAEQRNRGGLRASKHSSFVAALRRAPPPPYFF